VEKMETVTITLKNAPALYLEADTVSPDGFAGKTAAQIAELHVHEGNTTKKPVMQAQLQPTPGLLSRAMSRRSSSSASR
jgi:hypothetical protein